MLSSTETTSELTRNEMREEKPNRGDVRETSEAEVTSFFDKFLELKKKYIFI